MESASWFSRSGIREAHSGGFSGEAGGPADTPALQPAQPAIDVVRPRSGRCDTTGLPPPPVPAPFAAAVPDGRAGAPRELEEPKRPGSSWVEMCQPMTRVGCVAVASWRALRATRFEARERGSRWSLVWWPEKPSVVDSAGVTRGSWDSAEAGSPERKPWSPRVGFRGAGSARRIVEDSIRSTFWGQA